MGYGESAYLLEGRVHGGDGLVSPQQQAVAACGGHNQRAVAKEGAIGRTVRSTTEESGRVLKQHVVLDARDLATGRLGGVGPDVVPGRPQANSVEQYAGNAHHFPGAIASRVVTSGTAVGDLGRQLLANSVRMVMP